MLTCKIPIIKYRYFLSTTHTFTIALLSTTYITWLCIHMITLPPLKLYHMILEGLTISMQKFIKFASVIIGLLEKQKLYYYIKVFDTVNQSLSVRMTITIIHGIHQNILQKVLLIKKVPVLLYFKFRHCKLAPSLSRL